MFFVHRIYCGHICAYVGEMPQDACKEQTRAVKFMLQRGTQIIADDAQHPQRADLTKAQGGVTMIYNRWANNDFERGPFGLLCTATGLPIGVVTPSTRESMTFRGPSCLNTHEDVFWKGPEWPSAAGAQGSSFTAVSIMFSVFVVSKNS